MSITILEKGDIFFFYRPRVQEKQGENAVPHSIEEINRFYMILHPYSTKQYRLIIIGRKRMPEITAHERNWTTVELVTSKVNELKDYLRSETYQTETRGERFLPEARACGEGVYCITSRDSQTYLSYQLELPQQLGDVQVELSLKPEASYVLAVKNQKIAGSQSGKEANFPKHLQEQLRDLRFAAVNPPDFLDYPGAELLLIGANEDVEKELGIDLEPEQKSINTAEIFQHLKLWKNEHTVKPLFEGQWR